MRAFVVGLSIAILGGCGRLGFDDLKQAQTGDDDGGGGDGGNVDGSLGGSGAVPIACVPNGPEVCNGLDDNCDGVIDEGCPCTPITKTLTESPGLYTDHLVWTGTGYVQVGGNAAEIGAWPIDTTGTLGAFVALYDGMAGDTDGTSSAAWSGAAIGIAFDHNSGVVEMGHYDPATLAAGTTRLDSTYPGYVPQIAWAGDHFVVEWDSSTTLVARDVGADGTLLGPEQVVASNLPGAIEQLALTPTGSIACVRSDSDSTAIILTIDSSGTTTRHALPIGSGSSCQLLPIPNGFLVWNYTPITVPAPIAFVALDGTTAGTFTMPDLSPDSYTDIAIQWVGSGFWVLAAHTTSTLYAYDIDQLGYDDHGNLISGPTQLDSFSGYLWSSPRAIATGGETTWLWSADLNSWSFDQACP